MQSGASWLSSTTVSRHAPQELPCWVCLSSVMYPQMATAQSSSIYIVMFLPNPWWARMQHQDQAGPQASHIYVATPHLQA